MALDGSIDILTRHQIVGWALDHDRPGEAASLVVSAGGVVLGRCRADHLRPDLAAVDYGDGHHGFDFRPPIPLSPLQPYDIHVRREGDGASLPGSPRRLEAATILDDVTRRELESLLAAVSDGEVDACIAFLAAQTDRLRQRRADLESGAADHRHGYAVRFQDAGPAASLAPKGKPRPRALVIDVQMPGIGHDAASDAILSHMSVLQRLGYDVTFVATSLRGDTAALEAEGIAHCLHPSYVTVEEVLQRQPDVYRLVYLHRVGTAARYVALARYHQPRARLVYSVADLHFLRLARQAKIQDRPELLGLSRRLEAAEIAAAWQADAVITHSSFEAALLRTRVMADRVHVVPWTMPLRPVATPFALRRGLAFIGHYGHPPNADGARWLVEHVMPQVARQDPELPCLLVGSGMPDWLRALTRPPVAALGAVPDLATVFDQVRLTVAPLAFGAGIKGKVLASLAAGIPCACTTIAAEGLDLPPPLSELVADDPSALAAIILRLDRDKAFNARCAEAGLDYVATQLSQDAVAQLMQGVVR